MYRATQPIRGGLGSWEPGDPVADLPESTQAAWLAAGIIERVGESSAAPVAEPAALPELTFKELSAIAAEHGIKVKVGTKKADLIAAIQVVEAETSDAEPDAEA